MQRTTGLIEIVAEDRSVVKNIFDFIKKYTKINIYYDKIDNQRGYILFSSESKIPYVTIMYSELSEMLYINEESYLQDKSYLFNIFYTIDTNKDMPLIQSLARLNKTRRLEVLHTARLNRSVDNIKDFMEMGKVYDLTIKDDVRDLYTEYITRYNAGKIKKANQYNHMIGIFEDKYRDYYYDYLIRSFKDKGEQPVYNSIEKFIEDKLIHKVLKDITSLWYGDTDKEILDKYFDWELGEINYELGEKYDERNFF